MTNGTIFRVTTNGGFTRLFNFNSTNGSDPQARLLYASDGYFYGTTAVGGISNLGTIFRLTTNGDLTTLVQFTGANGGGPVAPLIEANDGNLYGTTPSPAMGFTTLGEIFRLVNPPLISGFDFSSGATTLTWTSFSNGIYRVESKTDLSNNVWTTLISRITAGDSTISITTNTTPARQQFYRVTLLP